MKRVMLHPGAVAMSDEAYEAFGEDLLERINRLPARPLLSVTNAYEPPARERGRPVIPWSNWVRRWIR